MTVASTDPLQSLAHRDWPPPDRPWLFAQRWRDLLFAHWPVSRDALARFIRPPLELDEYDGRAWVSLVPFWMDRTRLPRMPALPWLSTCIELNVRTYVRHAGRPGVLFLSLDAAKRHVVRGAQWKYHLPYVRARMSVRTSGERVAFESVRIDRAAPPADFRAVYGPTGPVAPPRRGSLEHALAEQYCLYVFDPAGRVWRGEIHHAPWPLQPATAEITVNTLPAAHGLTLSGPPALLGFSRMIDVRIWSLVPAE